MLKEKESISEKKVEENFTLKETLSAQRNEIEKLKKKVENTQDSITNKDFQIKQLTEDLNNFKKKNKNEANHNNGVHEDLKTELMVSQ